MEGVRPRLTHNARTASADGVQTVRGGLTTLRNAQWLPCIKINFARARARHCHVLHVGPETRHINSGVDAVQRYGSQANVTHYFPPAGHVGSASAEPAP